MQRHLSGRQRGRTGLWSLSCHLWPPGSWPWSSLRYTERPGEQRMKEKLIKIKTEVEGQNKVSPTAQTEMLRSNLKKFYFKRERNPPSESFVALFNFWWLRHRSSQCSAFCLAVPSLSAPHRLAHGQASSRRRHSKYSKSCRVCAPKQYSLSFPLCTLCLFWCSFTPWGLTELENENISPTSNAMT